MSPGKVKNTIWDKIASSAFLKFFLLVFRCIFVLYFYCIVCLLLLVYYSIIHFCFFIFVFLCVLYAHIFIGCHVGVINDDDDFTLNTSRPKGSTLFQDFANRVWRVDVLWSRLSSRELQTCLIAILYVHTAMFEI